MEGYAARAEMKERLRALSEWEIARRAGFTDASYAEYARHPDRAELAQALAALENMGLIAVWGRGAVYDSFVPTEAGMDGHLDGQKSSTESAAGPAPTVTGSFEQMVIERLDEIVRRLTKLEERLDGQQKS